MLGPEYEGVVGSDSWGAWNHTGRKHQKCHIHYIRDIKETTKYHSPSSEYKKHARTLGRILVDSRIDAAPGGTRALAAKKKLDRRIRDLLNRLKGETDKHCKRMFKRLRREKDHLFTFLEVKGVEWHNNSAERHRTVRHTAQQQLRKQIQGRGIGHSRVDECKTNLQSKER